MKCSADRSNSTSFLLYHWLSNQKKKIVKWSTITLSRLSKVNQRLTSHKFAINQVYKNIRNIWQDINSNLTYSRRSKLGEVSFSVIRFCLVHFSVKVPTWWWSESSRGLWFNSHKDFFYRFQWHCCTCGAVIVNLFVVLTTLEFSPEDTEQYLSRIKFWLESSIRNHRLSAL